MNWTPESRRAFADQRIADLTRYARANEDEGDAYEAQAASEEAGSWDFWATYGVTPEQWDEQQRQEDEREKRYAVKDQHGATLTDFDNYAHAALYLRDWNSDLHPEHAGCGIWDAENEEWATRWFPEDASF